MWPRECFLFLGAVLFVSGVSLSDSSVVGMDAVMSKLELILEKLELIEENARKTLNYRPENRTENETEPTANHVNNSRLENEEQQLRKLEEMERSMMAQEESLQRKLAEIECTANTNFQTLQKQIAYNDVCQKNGQKAFVSSCKEIPANVSGKYEIQLGPNKKKLSVYCEQTAHGGGWIVFQYRYNGKENFNRSWVEYRDGFGSLDGEFWLGLESVHQLTSARPHELLVEIKDKSGNYGYEKYDSFTVGSECQGYKLSVGSSEGTAAGPYGLHRNNNHRFETYDRVSLAKCITYYGSPWWNSGGCHYTNLNSNYRNAGHKYSNVFWYNWKNDYRALAYTRMMIRDVSWCA